MPTISNFYGVTIIMHQREKEHNPPHIHAVTAEFEATFYIKTAEMMSGGCFPNRAKEMVKEFILMHQDELLEIWETGNYRKLKPID